MKNQIKFFEAICSIAAIRSIAIIALVALIGFGIAACSNPVGGGGGSSSGSGSSNSSNTTTTNQGFDSSLVGTWVNNLIEVNFFDNGTLEQTLSGGIPEVKGTYTANSQTATMTPTHIGGIGIGLDPSKWYTKDEALAQAAPQHQDKINNVYFAAMTLAYSISGNTLTVDHGNGEIDTLTRKS